jgi:aryl-alcohol dehydrogenase-like predicted oxidoreductase
VRALQLLGEAIKTLPREDVKIATKIGKYAPGKSFTITATAGRLL